VTGGGHLEFSHEKVEGKMEIVFFQSFWVSQSEKTQLFKIYMKKSQNDTMTHTQACVMAQFPTIIDLR